MGAFVDRTGQRFGRLVVVASAGVASHRARWLCRCDCGGEITTLGQTLKAGNAKSCGCLFREVRRQKGRNTTHGMSSTLTHRIWVGMWRRCTNLNDAAYPRYGGRGITVCQQWRDFAVFLRDMGECPHGLEIERTDVNGNYEPGNCRWASVVDQANNKRNNRVLFHGGGWMTVAEYARATGIKYATAYYRKVVRNNEALPREVIVRRLTAERSLLMEDAE